MRHMNVDSLRDMVGHHLAWDDRIRDEFRSFTKSPLFAFVHANQRHLMGQKDVYIHIFDTRHAYRPKWYVNQESQQEQESNQPVEFLHAPAICDATKLYRGAWSKEEMTALHPRKFTHEYLAHGVVAISEDSRLQPVSLRDLVENGFYTLVPELRVPAGTICAGLWTTLRCSRRILHETAKPCTAEELDIAERLSRLHTRSTPDEPRTVTRPNLWIFMSYLSFRKRSDNDPLFRDKIRQLGYTRGYRIYFF